MSGVGKSHVSRMLAAAGWAWHDCDRAIAEHLADLVTPEPGEEPVHALGRWMGMPWSEGYADREKRYLQLEESVTRAALERSLASPGPHVIDTTGSVIYLSEALRADLRKETFVLYLHTSEALYAAMLALYLREPKPVVWGGLFELRAGESHEAALARCYPQLLRERDARYRALGHARVDSSRLRNATLETTLAFLRA
jgi:shikimate kinase